MRVPGGFAEQRSRLCWSRLCWSRLGWMAGFAVAGVLLFVLYLQQSTRGTYVTSDGASNALQAWDMLHGNLLLRGWAMSDVSFYTTELPQYMLVESIRGLGPGVVHVAAAMTYTLLVLLAGLLAKGRATGAEGIARALLASGIMLAPQLGNPTGTLMLSPDHVGTGVPLLVIWLMVDRGQEWAKARPALPRPALRWLVPAAVGVLLAWTEIGDPLAEVIGALPLAAVCAIRAYQGLALRREPLAARWYELSLAAAAVASVPVALVATRLIASAGGWTITPVRTGFAAASVLSRNAALTFQGVLQLYGADFTGQPMSHLVIFAFVHLIGVGLVVWALCLAARRFFAGELLAQVLTLAIAVNLAAYVFTVQAQNITTTREIAAVLPFGAALAGRLVTGRLLAIRLAPVLAAVFACYALMLVSDAVQPPVPTPNTDLTVWLAAHDLTRGLGSYWDANSITLDSGNNVQVRSIAIDSGKVIPGSYWEARKAWYNPAENYADFVVTVARLRDSQLMWQMEAIAGRPSRIYHFGPYTIAVWDENLLARLH